VSRINVGQRWRLIVFGIDTDTIARPVVLVEAEADNDSVVGLVDVNAFKPDSQRGYPPIHLRGRTSPRGS
jgi:hypothetical protein